MGSTTIKALEWPLQRSVLRCQKSGAADTSVFCVSESCACKRRVCPHLTSLTGAQRRSAPRPSCRRTASCWARHAWRARAETGLSPYMARAAGKAPFTADLLHGNRLQHIVSVETQCAAPEGCFENVVDVLSAPLFSGLREQSRPFERTQDAG